MHEWHQWPIYKVDGWYVRGKLPSASTPMLAVVGARRMSEYGKRAVMSIIPTIASCGVVIVSGFMYGVDAAAHQAALDAHGITVAVLGSGLDVPCPSYHQALYTQILASGGAVISQFAPHEAAQRWMFPKRNGLVAKISQAALVIEAGAKSGSLITAREAQKLGKPVMAVPGDIFSPLSEGTHELIRQGAALVRSADDVLAVMGIHHNSQIPNLNKPSSIDELARKLNMSIPELSSQLSLMVLRGQIIEREGLYYAR